MSITATLREMLKLVNEREHGRCDEIRAQAGREAGALVNEAHRAVRDRMRQNVRELRARIRGRVSLSEAELQTAKRRYQQRRDAALLDGGWARLRTEFECRWREPGARREWVGSLARQALRLLPRGPWQVRHPRDWPAAERQALRDQLAAELGQAPEFVADEALACGLRLCAQGACVDGTIEGLLADRVAIEAMLLAEIEK